MATVSNKIVLGTSNTVQLGSVPDKQYAEVIITINDKEVLKKSCSAGVESFVWDLGFEEPDFESIFNGYFSPTSSSVSAKMTVTVFFSTGVKNLLRGGKYDISFQLIDNTKTKPIIDSVTLSPVSDKEFEKYIQGKTKAKCIVKSEGRYGAEIKSVAVSIDGKSCTKTDEGFVSDWLYSFGYRNVIITVTDTRGFTSTKTEQICVEPYSPPIIVPLGANPSIIHGRWNPNTEKFDDSNGTQCRILFGVYASYIEGVNDLISCSYRYKVAGGEEIINGENIVQINFNSSSLQTGVDLLIEDGTTTDENGKITGCFGIENEYLIELTITDSLGEKATKTFHLDVLECIWHIVGKRFSVGKYATKDEIFDSAWTIHTDKNLSVAGKVEELGEPLPVAFGGTGADTAEKARKNLGISLENLGVSASADDINLLLGVKTSGVTTANIKYLKGVSFNVQDQLNEKSKADHTHEGYAPSSHIHTGYAPSDHEHDMDDIIAAPSTKCESTILVTILSSINSDVELVEDECWATVWGKVCEIYISFKYNKPLTASENFENIKIGTLASAYKPTHYVGCHSGGAGFVASGEITSSGVLNLASVGSDVPANSKMSLTATYLLP